MRSETLQGETLLEMPEGRSTLSVSRDSTGSKLVLCLKPIIPVFFGGGLDHVIYLAAGFSRSHYGLELTPLQQGAFAVFDVTIAATLLWLHVRWDRRRSGHNGAPSESPIA